LNILVTGGAGYIGSRLVEKLAETGDMITVIDPSCESNTNNNIRHVEAYIIDNITAWHTSFANIIFHFAAISNIDKISYAPMNTIETNIMGTVKMLFYRDIEQCKNFIYASTVYVYEEAGHIYTATKRASEDIIKAYNKLYGIPYTILRFSTVYGPGNRDDNVINKFVKLALAGKDLVVCGNGEQLRHYLYIDDAVDASIYAMDCENEIINVLGSPATVNEVALMIQAEVPDTNIIYNGARIDDYTGKVGKGIATMLGKTSLQEGISKTIEAYRNAKEKVS